MNNQFSDQQLLFRASWHLALCPARVLLLCADPTKKSGGAVYG